MIMASPVRLAVSLAWDFSMYTPTEILHRLPVALVAEMILERRARLGITEDKTNNAAGVAMRSRLVNGLTNNGN